MKPVGTEKFHPNLDDQQTQTHRKYSDKAPRLFSDPNAKTPDFFSTSKKLKKWPKAAEGRLIKLKEQNYSWKNISKELENKGFNKYSVDACRRKWSRLESKKAKKEDFFIQGKKKRKATIFGEESSNKRLKTENRENKSTESLEKYQALPTTPSYSDKGTLWDPKTIKCYPKQNTEMRVNLESPTTPYYSDKDNVWDPQFTLEQTKRNSTSTVEKVESDPKFTLRK